MAFYQKYRPQNFNDLIGEEHVSATLIEGIKSGKLTHAYLFTGPRGTGKTTTARLLAKAINCEGNSGEKGSGEPCNQCISCNEIKDGRSIDIVEIDAASHTKVDEIREVIENARFLPTKSKKKVYIIDEVHMLSNSSFNALLKTLEEPPKHVVFILATTEAHKLPQTIISRTQRYDFNRVSKDAIIHNLKKIAKSEKINISDEALDLIAVAAEGGHRDAIGLLEQVASVSLEIEIADVERLLGVSSQSEVFEFLGAIFNKNPEEGLKIAHRLYEGGLNMSAFNKRVIEMLRRILLLSMSGEALFEDTKENLAALKKMSKGVNANEIIHFINIFIRSGDLLKDISYPILPIEMAVVEAAVANQIPTKNVVKDLVETEKTKSEKPKEAYVITSAVAVEAKASKLAEPTEEAKIEEENFVPVAVLDMTDDLWQRVVDKTKEENATLAALLRDAKPIEFSKSKVVLGVKFPFHKDKISEEKNRAFLEGVFSDLVGGKCTLSCQITDFKPKIQTKEASEDLEKVAEEVFG